MEANKEMVLVEWHDAKFTPGTYNEKAIQELRMALFRSLGYLITRDNITTIIATEHNDQEEYRDITLIPSGSVISIKRLLLAPAM